jgi:hypothetical protein
MSKYMVIVFVLMMSLIFVLCVVILELLWKLNK